MNLGFNFLPPFFHVGFVSLVAPLQPLFKTLGDMKKVECEKLPPPHELSYIQFFSLVVFNVNVIC
jgi:hypothetical protein